MNHNPSKPPESILLSAARIGTFDGQRPLTGASGFFFERDERLYLVTSRHVLVDEPSKHFPDRIEIELHTDPDNLTRSTGLSMLLYREGQSVWRDATDSGGEIDVAVIEIERTALPQRCVLEAFTPAHLPTARDDIEVGAALLVVGFPLGFHDLMHHLPVVRQAVIASSYGLRFQGKGYFLTDARTHRGTSGAPVPMRDTTPAPGAQSLPWKLLGVTLVAHGHRRPRPDSGRGAGTELRLVRRHPDDAHRTSAHPRPPHLMGCWGG